MRHSGLTFFEFIIIILIISLVAAVYIDVKKTDEFKRQQSCADNLNEISRGLAIHRHERRGAHPASGAALAESLSKYNLPSAVFTCPFSRKDEKRENYSKFYVKRSVHDAPGAFVTFCPHRDGYASVLFYSGEVDVCKMLAVLSGGEPLEPGETVNKDITFYDDSSVRVKKGAVTLTGSIKLPRHRHYDAIQLSTKVGDIEVTTAPRSVIDIVFNSAGIIQCTKDARIMVRWYLEADRQIAEASVRNGYAVLTNDHGMITIAEDQIALIESGKPPILIKHRQIYPRKEVKETKQ